MTTVLKNVVVFTNLSIGVPVSLPHLCNVHGVDVIPDLVVPQTGGFTVTADDVNITVTSQTQGVAALNVYVEHWHTIEDAEPPGGLGVLLPFIVMPGSSGGSSSGPLILGSIITPPPISGTVNNYSPTGLSTAAAVYQDMTGDTTLTGLDATGMVEGQIIEFINISTFILTVGNENTGSLAADRFTLPGAADIPIVSGGSITVRRRAATSRWLLIART